MAYIGNIPAVQYASFSKQTLIADSSTVSFTLDNSVANENEIEVFVNNVRQEPGSGKAYTASGTTLTMSAAPTTGDSFYVIFQGKATQTVTAPAGSVTTSQLADSSVTTAKILDANITSAKLASGVLPTNTPAFWVGQTSSQSVSNNTETKVTLDSETYDTDNAFSSNKFTVPSGEGGLYAFNWNIRLNLVSDGATFITSLYKNGSEVPSTRNRDQLGATTDFFHNGAVTLSLAAADYIELYIQSSGGSTTTNPNYVYLSGYKIIGV